MIWFILWLLAVEVASAAVLPLAVRLFRPLPDRGFIFAKPLGMLLVGYAAWLPGVLGILRYQPSTIAVLAILLAAVCWYLWGRDAIKQLAGMRGLVLVSEAVFLLALAGAAVIRAYNPEISGTEKPMDFAILNGIFRSDTLPPEDPWLSGYSISYYYFGYYLLATVGKLATIPAAAVYNLGVALIFALLLAGSFSLAFNLLSALRPNWSMSGRVLGALVAPVVIGLMGNLEIALEVLAAQGYSNPAFWQWAGIKNLKPQAQPSGFFPSDFWWWWRASRVIPTTQPDGINEFPYFSYLLGDLHPHYTALPWAALSMAAAMATALRRGSGPHVAMAPALRRESESHLSFDWVSRVVVALVLGFLLVGNSWDFPAYTGLLWLAALVPLRASEWNLKGTLPRVKELLWISVLSALLYIPFFLGFSSQTKGIGLSADRTPLASLLIIFGTVIVGLVGFLSWRSLSSNGAEVSGDRRWRITAVVGLAAVAGSPALGSLGVIVGVLLLVIAALGRLTSDAGEADRTRAAAALHLLLALIGMGLILVPEFVFIADLFGTRMNTVFKFHYEAWLLLGLAASVGVVCMLREASALPKVVTGVSFALLVGVGLLYPLGATLSKTQDFKNQPTLDGLAFFRSSRPDDFAAIEWLRVNTRGRPAVLEATGGPYSEYARVSTFSGLPTVLGWGGHEAQWGRSGALLQARTQDIEAIYSTAGQESAIALLQKYHVEYVFVGSLEADKYGPAVLERFSGLLEPAFRQGRAAIYRVPQR